MLPEGFEALVVPVAQRRFEVGVFFLVHGELLLVVGLLRVLHIRDAITELDEDSRSLGGDLDEGFLLALFARGTLFVGDQRDIFDDVFREADVAHVVFGLVGVLDDVVAVALHQGQVITEAESYGDFSNAVEMELVGMASVSLVAMSFDAPSFGLFERDSFHGIHLLVRALACGLSKSLS